MHRVMALLCLLPGLLDVQLHATAARTCLSARVPAPWAPAAAAPRRQACLPARLPALPWPKEP